MSVRRHLSLIAIVLAAASLTVPFRHVAAQGALQAARSASAAPTRTAGEGAEQPARSVVRQLVGRWRFAIWFAGNFDGPPDASGTRMVEALYDDLRLQWTEELDHSTSRSQGIIGFDRRTGRFYSSAVYSESAGAELLTGTLNPSEPIVTFTPVAPTPNAGTPLMESFTLTVIDRDHFTWAPLDRGWRAVFTREP